jgi:hypothetical protein
MRGLLLAVALVAAACEGSPSNATSLEGTVSCGTLTCTSGQVCTFIFAGIDAGAGPGGNYYCATVPTGCAVVDCSGTSDCSACIDQLCYPTDVIDVVGRMVRCMGQ